MPTYIPKGDDIQRDWFVIDAKDKVLGRVATLAASILSGKTKPVYTPFLDTGDHVVVINAGKVALTGRKTEQKVYRRHTGYMGGLREVSAEKMLQTHPERLLEEAIKGMLPKTKLGKAMATKLKVYAGEQHPHQAQKPKPITVK
jgi:large subunit ribosomal protein L13